jgi:hypothetical protein
VQETANYLASKGSLSSGALAVLVPATVPVRDDSPIPLLETAFLHFSRLDPYMQAKVVNGAAKDPLLDLLIESVRQALAAVCHLANPLDLLSRNENSINMLVGCQLRTYLAQFGWTAVDQPPTGYSIRGGVGEADIVIKKVNNDLAVFEAMKFSTDKLRGARKHFDKVPRYSSCRIFFHATYYDDRSVDNHLQSLRTIARTPPQGLQLISVDRISSSGSLPDGWIGTYRYGLDRDISIVFLLADIQQEMQKTIGIAAT